MAITNYASIIGRLTAEPELKTTNSGTSVLDISVAVQRPYNKENEHPETDFINCTLFGKTAEFVAKYFGKGKVIGITGRIKVDKWQDDEGKTRHSTKIIAEHAEFIPGVPKENNNEDKPTPTQPDKNADEDGGDDEYPW